MTRDTDGAPLILSPVHRLLYGVTGTKFLLCLLTILLATWKVVDDTQYAVIVIGALTVYSGSNVANNVAARRRQEDEK